MSLSLEQFNRFQTPNCLRGEIKIQKCFLKKYKIKVIAEREDKKELKTKNVIGFCILL